MSGKQYVAKASEYLLDKLRTENPALFAAIGNGSKEIVSFEMYHSIKLPSLLGPQELLRASNKYEEGISNFNGNALAKDEPMAFSEIAILYGKTGDGTGTAPSPDTIEYSNLILDSRKNTIINATSTATPNTAPDVRIPVAFQNSGFNIQVGNGKVYEANIGSHLVNHTVIDTAEKQFIQGKTPKLLRPETPIQLNYRGVANGTVPAAHHYIKIIIRGVIVKDKA